MSSKQTRNRGRYLYFHTHARNSHTHANRAVQTPRTPTLNIRADATKVTSPMTSPIREPDGRRSGTELETLRHAPGGSRPDPLSRRLRESESSGTSRRLSQIQSARVIVPPSPRRGRTLTTAQPPSAREPRLRPAQSPRVMVTPLGTIGGPTPFWVRRKAGTPLPQHVPVDGHTAHASESAVGGRHQGIACDERRRRACGHCVGSGHCASSGHVRYRRASSGHRV